MKEKINTNKLEELITRENYLVVQGNDLAKAFGNLTAFELKVLDYCFSIVQEESKPNEVFKVKSRDIINFFRNTTGGKNYDDVAKAFKTLNENTALYLPQIKNGEKSIIMTQLFSYIEFFESGKVEFEFSNKAIPYVFDLKKHYYSFHLREIASIKGKYTSILLKLWSAKRYKKNQLTIIEGSLEEWQEWFLGRERKIKPGEFKRSVLSKAIHELEEKINCDITLITNKSGRNVVGYTIEIIDNRV